VHLLDAAGGGYHRWYTGVARRSELLCRMCHASREAGDHVEARVVCEACERTVREDFGPAIGVRGTPSIETRDEPFPVVLRETRLPATIGQVVDLAPLEAGPGSSWLLLSEARVLWRFDADESTCVEVGRATHSSEAEHVPWNGRALRPRLHASPCGGFAAIVNDYGRFGQLIDLHRGAATLELDGGDYCSDTVPFAFAFMSRGGRTLAVHRTAWNRLDASDAATGELLTAREVPTDRDEAFESGKYLDYFHGALYVSPGGRWIANDGWVWHPVGMVTAFDGARWAVEDCWEPERGATLTDVCDRMYYWDAPLVWIDASRLAVSGLGDDDLEMVPGVRIFDLSIDTAEPPREQNRRRRAKEITSFAGPSGLLFSDGGHLFASAADGLSRFSLEDGARNGLHPGFSPTHRHCSTGELACVVDGRLLRAKVGAAEPAPA